MSLQPNGSYVCDRCGADVGNGGVDQAARIADTDPQDATRLRSLHLCLDRIGTDGNIIQGCRGRVLTKRALRAYHEKKESQP